MCSEDGSARAALAFLRGRGVDVPRDISVVGFENTPAAYEHDLCSYDFNMTGILQSMVGYILAPKTLRGPERVVEVDGYVVERGSVGRARR